MSLESKDLDVVLADVEPEHYFIIKGGRSVKSLEDLSEALKKMDDDTFAFHVTASKNDFSNWVKDILNDKELAQSIDRVKTKNNLAKKIDKRIEKLKFYRDHLRSLEEFKGLEEYELEASKTKHVREGLKDYAFGIVIGAIIGFLIGMLF